MRNWTLVCLIVSLCAGCVRADDLPRAQPEEVGFSAERLAYLDRFYTDKVQKGEMSGVVTLIARYGRIAHFSAVGYSNLEKKQKMQTDTIFRLYSMTKPIASTALMMLYQEGRFQMSEPLSKYIPEFAQLRVLRTPDAPITDTVPMDREPTLHDVFRHTAGFTHGNSSDPVGVEYIKDDVSGLAVSLEQMMSKLARIPLRYQPGTKFNYSVAPDVQARLVEVLSGMPFEEFLKKRLFEPLRMNETAYWVPPEKAQRLAVWYWTDDGKLIPLDRARSRPKTNTIFEPWSINSYGVAYRHMGGSIGLVSTAEDYWRFAQMLLNGGVFNGVRLLSPHVIQYMTIDHLGGIELELGPDFRGLSFGLGFLTVRDPAALRVVSTEGSFFFQGAAGTFFYIDPGEDMVVVAMMQGAVGSFWQTMRTLVYGALMEKKASKVPVRRQARFQSKTLPDSLP